MAEIANDNDVVHFLEKDDQPIDGFTAKVSEVIAEISACVSNEGRWKTEGVSCEYLKVRGDGWKKGKLFIRLEFIPDENSQSETYESLTTVE